MNEKARDLKWKLSDLSDRDSEDHDEIANEVGAEGIALLTIGVIAFAVVMLGSIIFCLIKLAAEKIISWNVLQVIKTALDKLRNLNEELFYGKDMTK